MGKKKKTKKKNGITFHLVPRDKDPNSIHRHWWDPENISSEEEYEKMLAFMGKQNLDLLSEDWRPEDYEEPVHHHQGLNLKKLCGDLLGDGEYDQFIVEEVSDEEIEDPAGSDKIVIEKNVKAPRQTGKNDLIFIEPGYENHISIFADDNLTAREMDYVLNRISMEGVQKHAKNNQDLKEVLAALENPDEFEEANEDWLLGFDEDEDQGFWGPVPTQPEPVSPIMPEKPQPAPAESKPQPPEPAKPREPTNANEENQAVNYEIEDMDEAAFANMLQEFDDDKIGELDDEEVDAEVGVPASTYSHLYDDFIEKRKRDWGIKPGEKVQDYVNSYVNNYVEETEEQTKIEIDRLTWRPDRNRWDCESVISTYSNLENHPQSLKLKTIKTKNKIEFRKGRPVLEKDMNLGIIFEDEKEEESDSEIGAPMVMIELPNKREKNETREEKKRRKQLVKQQRRLARQQKRALKRAFKEEKKKQDKISVALKSSHNEARAL